MTEKRLKSFSCPIEFKIFLIFFCKVIVVLKVNCSEKMIDLLPLGAKKIMAYTRRIFGHFGPPIYKIVIFVGNLKIYMYFKSKYVC